MRMEWTLEQVDVERRVVLVFGNTGCEVEGDNASVNGYFSLHGDYYVGKQ